VISFQCADTLTYRQNKKSFKKQVLIMDEVDGMSAGDRGGIAELIMIIKKTKV
jgi:replication factor C subunit 1